MPGLTAAIVIVTFNRPDYLEEALGLWEKSDRQPDQFIVVDASPDASVRRRDVLGRHRSLFADHADYMVSGRASIPAQRNLSLSSTRTDIVLYVDDDCRPTPELLGRIVEVFEADKDANIGGVSGWGADWRTLRRRVGWAVSAPIRRYVARFGLSRHEAFPPEVTVPRALQKRLPLTRVRELRGCAMAFRTPLVQRLRFDPVMEGYAFAEDFDISYRIGRTHALVRRNDTIIDYAVAAGTSVPSAHYFLLSWINPAYLIEKLRLGDASRRALLRRLNLSKRALQFKALFSSSVSTRPSSEWFDIAGEMISYIWDGKPDSVVERYRELQALALSVGEDESLVEN